ncbi:MAG: hypothetical protein ACE5J2_08865 [Nitrososphaerales archaeon]
MKNMMLAASTLKMRILGLALLIALVPYTSAFAESSSNTIDAVGTVSSFNDSPASGLWAAVADFESGTGDIVAVFENEQGDIYVVTVRGDSAFEGEDLTISGEGYLAKNGELLTEGSGTAIINESGMEIRVSEDAVFGQTVS